MRILVTNDDGIHARGLEVAERIARQFSDDVWVIAPSEEQSGAGHSLTLTRPLRLRKHGEKRFSVSGTPTDTVMMALLEVMDPKPDLILSGVNRGANLGEDATYSGTISAAMEGALAGIRSIALSQVYAREGAGDEVPFAAAEAWGERAIRPLLAAPFAPGMLVSINFPALPPEEVKGIRVVQQGVRDYGRAKMVKQTDPRGFPYYWLSFHGIVETAGDNTDLEAIRAGYVSVTPLHLDLTYRDALATLTARY
jgi:5'-nucleotidase